MREGSAAVLYQTPGHGFQEFLEGRRPPSATEARPSGGENPKKVLSCVQILAAGTTEKMSPAPVEAARGGEQAL